MNSNLTLFSVGQYDLKLKHLLIIGILSLSFSISFLIRSQPAEWGWELNEFDPFFNYRATEYLVENGVGAYFQWNDDLSWYPNGRDVSGTSQVMLHLTAATTYVIFGTGMELYDFTILFPVIVGSLTCIVVFALVRVIGGTTAGLFASLLFSISLPIIIRGPIGWFKSEPLGLLFSIFAVYLFLSGIKSKNQKNSFAKLVFAGIFIIFGISAWGGDQFFLLPLGLFLFTLPFLRSDHKFLLWSIPTFTISTISASLVFERLGTNFVMGLGGFSLIIPTIFLICCILIQNRSDPSHKTRNGLIFLVALIVVASSLLVFSIDSELIQLPSFRYLNAINPFLITSDPLVDSVTEHATTTIQQSFLFHSILMLFAGIAVWLLLTNSKKYDVRNDMLSFTLIIGMFGVYISSAFVRLEVFASLSIIIFSSLSLSILLREFFSNKTKTTTISNVIIKSSFALGIIVLLVIPLSFPENSTIFAITDSPPTILNGGTNFQISQNDWIESLTWVKNNTPDDSVVASWWDYGYWIQTKGERATIADNSTLSTYFIKILAKTFLETPEQGWQSLQKLDADYFIVFVSSQRIDYTGSESQPLYLLGGGGDESKKQWFMRIANEPLNKHLHSDGRSGTDHFWNDTMLGNMIPYSVIGYINTQTDQQSLTYQHGFTPIYEKNIKFPKDGNGPFKLVYSSPSFDRQDSGPVLGVFVYEINKDYVLEN